MSDSSHPGHLKWNQGHFPEKPTLKEQFMPSVHRLGWHCPGSCLIMPLPVATGRAMLLLSQIILGSFKSEVLKHV